jgi:phosphatidylinositol 4-kinase A
VVCTSSDVRSTKGHADCSVTFGNNRIQLMTDYHLVTSLSNGLERDPDTGEDIREAKRLLQLLLKDETFRIYTWLSPLSYDSSVTPVNLDESNWLAIVRAAWKLDPYLAVHLSERFTSPIMQKEIRRLVMANPEDVIESPVAAQILLGDSLSPDLRFQLKVLLSIIWLIVVFIVLGTSCPSYGHNLLLTIIS